MPETKEVTELTIEQKLEKTANMLISDIATIDIYPSTRPDDYGKKYGNITLKHKLSDKVGTTDKTYGDVAQRMLDVFKSNGAFLRFPCRDANGKTYPVRLIKVNQEKGYLVVVSEEKYEVRGQASAMEIGHFSKSANAVAEVITSQQSDNVAFTDF